MGDALRAGKPAPPSKLSNVQPILDALSEDKNRRLNEISSVIVVAEAGDDFPQHIVQKIVELEQDKRETLQQLVREWCVCVCVCVCGLLFSLIKLLLF